MFGFLREGRFKESAHVFTMKLTQRACVGPLHSVDTRYNISVLNVRHAAEDHTPSAPRKPAGPNFSPRYVVKTRWPFDITVMPSMSLLLFLQMDKSQWGFRSTSSTGRQRRGVCKARFAFCLFCFFRLMNLLFEFQFKLMFSTDIVNCYSGFNSVQSSP